MKTFNKIKEYYLNELKQYSKSIWKIILLGNKADLEEERKVSKEEGLALAEQNGLIFMETSCVSNCNVSSAFETLIEITNTEMRNNNCQRLKTNYVKGNIKKCC